MSQNPQSDAPRPHRTHYAFALLVLVGGVVIGLAGSGFNFGQTGDILNQTGGACHGRIAEKLVELDLAPRITDEMITRAVNAAIARASEGDADGVSLLLELASRQRASAAD